METGRNLKSIVYLTVNTVNNKIYVGVHITEKPYEWDSYYGCGISGTSSYWFKHPKYPFQRACKKYGLNVFKRYTLFVFDSYDEARKMEAQIVNEEFVKRPDTYNVALGGGCGLVPSTEIEVHQYDLEGKYIKTYRSKADAGRKNNCDVMTINHAILYKSILKDSYWSECKVARLSLDDAQPKLNKKLYVYNNNGDLIETFDSIADYARANDINQSVVQRALIRKIKCAGNYISTIKLDKFIKEEKVRIRDRKLYQYDMNGNFLAEYPNSSYVKEICGEKYRFLHTAINNHNSCAGYLWSFEKLDHIEPLKVIKKKIAQYDLEGNLIKV